AFRDITCDKVPFEIVTVGGKTFTRDLRGFKAEVAKLKASGGGDTPESSYEGIVKATELGWRKQAFPILILITDGPPQQKAPSIREDVVLRALRDKKIDQLHIVCNKSEKAIYERLQSVSKGTWFELKRGKIGFDALLPILSREIARITIAAGPAAP